MAKEVQEIKRESEKKIQELKLQLQETPGNTDLPKEDPVEEFFRESLCPNNDKERRYLKSLLGNKEFVLTLLYRASKEEAMAEGTKHKTKAEYFHRMCDNKGPTVSLMKLNNGSCIGGYTSSKWRTPPSSFLGAH